MTPLDVIAWLLAVQAVLVLAVLALLGFSVWKARALVDGLTTAVDGLTRAAAGADWKTDRMAEAFTRAAAGIELSGQAAWSASVACHAIAKEVRPVVHGQAPGDDQPLSVDLTGLLDPEP